jgi:hypothetical protein
MGGPPPVPLIPVPSWAARTVPGSGSSSPPPPNPDQWLLDIKAVFNQPEDKVFLDDLIRRGVTITAFDKIRFDDPIYDGTKWTVKVFDAGGSQRGTTIDMISSSRAVENAATIFHEGVHTGQPSSMSWNEKEYDAYTKEEAWRIAHGLSGRAGFRTTDASGAVVPDVAAIKAMVDRVYPISTTTTSTGLVERVVGMTADGKTKVVRSDGTDGVREPKAGDTFPGPKVTDPPTGIPVDLAKLK